MSSQSKQTGKQKLTTYEVKLRGQTQGKRNSCHFKGPTRITENPQKQNKNPKASKYILKVQSH